MSKELARIEKTAASIEAEKGVVSRRKVFKQIGQASLAVASLFLFTKQSGCSYSDWSNYSNWTNYSNWANWYNYSSSEK